MIGKFIFCIDFLYKFFSYIYLFAKYLHPLISPIYFMVNFMSCPDKGNVLLPCIPPCYVPDYNIEKYKSWGYTQKYLNLKRKLIRVAKGPILSNITV